MAPPKLPNRLNSHFSITIFLFILLSFSTFSLANSTTENLFQSECLKVPNSVFINTVGSAINTIRSVTGIVSQFANLLGDFRLSTAVSDCLDLLDLSADELSWSLSATQNPKGKNNSTGNLSYDMRTWLSAALANQDTCSDGFEGTNSFVKDVVVGSLGQVTSLVTELLSMVHPVPEAKLFKGGINGRNLQTKDQFPSWVSSKDRKLVQVNGVSVDVTVALDGTGNYTSVSAAVLEAPDYSSRRYVIYVKRGVYKENVEIKKKKWNLMMFGDGMEATVISGNRSFIDGWTTFRSATFAVSGRGFLARDMTFENTAGPEKHQAVALRSDSDLSVFYRCSIKGYQDSLYTHTMRQFFRECNISAEHQTPLLLYRIKPRLALKPCSLILTKKPFFFESKLSIELKFCRSFSNLAKPLFTFLHRSNLEALHWSKRSKFLDSTKKKPIRAGLQWLKLTPPVSPLLSQTTTEAKLPY